MDSGFDGDKLGKPISAAEARKLVQTSGDYRPNDRNYALTIRRLYKIIENAAKDGCDSVVFVTPKFILDGSVADPIYLAKQLKARLSKLGYRVRREENVLRIEWDAA